jgi:hypothetical protein
MIKFGPFCFSFFFVFTQPLTAAIRVTLKQYPTEDRILHLLNYYYYYYYYYYYTKHTLSISLSIYLSIYLYKHVFNLHGGLKFVSEVRVAEPEILKSQSPSVYTLEGYYVLTFENFDLLGFIFIIYM